jgi:hypothetical protein
MMEVRKLEDGYELVVTVLLAHQGGVTIEDITLFAYTKEGSRVAHREVGTLDDSRRMVTIEKRCSGFPAIVTFDAATSVCENVMLPIVYIKSPVTPTEDRSWEQTPRECGGGLPPERILDRYGTASPTES